MSHSSGTDSSVETTLRREEIRCLQLAPPPCVQAGVRLREALALMKGHRSGTVLVCEGEKLAGIFTERDVLVKILGRDIDLDQPVDPFMTAGPRTLAQEDRLEDAIRLMTEGSYRHVPIVDPENRPVGLLGARDLVDFIAEHFPAEVVNLPPRLHLTSVAPEGA